MAELTDYGKIARDYLEEHDPQEFQRLKRQGQLNAHLTKVGNRVLDQISAVHQDLLERKPPPEEPFLKRVQAMKAARLQAVEIVLANEFPPKLPPGEISKEDPPAVGPPPALI